MNGRDIWHGFESNLSLAFICFWLKEVNEDILLPKLKKTTQNFFQFDKDIKHLITSVIHVAAGNFVFVEQNFINIKSLGKTVASYFIFRCLLLLKLLKALQTFFFLILKGA
jgi:hypothetical protein